MKGLCGQLDTSRQPGVNEQEPLPLGGPEMIRTASKVTPVNAQGHSAAMNLKFMTLACQGHLLQYVPGL